MTGPSRFYHVGYFYSLIVHCCYLLNIVSGMKIVSTHLTLKTVLNCNCQSHIQLGEWRVSSSVKIPELREQPRLSGRGFLNTCHISGLLFYLKMFKEGTSRFHRGHIMSASLLLFCRESSNTEIALPFPAPDGPLDKERPQGKPECSLFSEEKYHPDNS